MHKLIAFIKFVIFSSVALGTLIVVSILGILLSLFGTIAMIVTGLWVGWNVYEEHKNEERPTSGVGDVDKP